ncbi:MAG TPA: hypothetical protein VLV87_10580 [Gammaproteobacteria bacterium]|nr:hypothetical protein [Gammaproteobacteria bacterium]
MAAKADAAAVAVAAAPVVNTPVETGWGPTPEQRKQRRVLVLLLLLLLLPVSFWLGRSSVVPRIISPPAKVVYVPVPATAQAAAQTPAPHAITKAAEAAPPAASAVITTDAATPETKLLEVSVGTSTRGGLTLMFDHPVEWTTSNPADSHAQLDVAGVHALSTFPRNLPLPPGVKAIHAVIGGKDVLSLRFGLKPGVQAYTFPGNGPSAVVNVYFRTPIEEAASGDTMRAGSNGIPMGSGGCGAASAASAKAVTLLQRSLDKNPSYAAVRTALAVLMTCDGESPQAEQAVASGLKLPAKAPVTVTLAVVDAALLYARGDAAEAMLVLKSNAPAKADPGYDELLADFTAAAD